MDVLRIRHRKEVEREREIPLAVRNSGQGGVSRHETVDDPSITARLIEKSLQRADISGQELRALFGPGHSEIQAARLRNQPHCKVEQVESGREKGVVGLPID